MCVESLFSNGYIKYIWDFFQFLDMKTLQGILIHD